MFRKAVTYHKKPLKMAEKPSRLVERCFSGYAHPTPGSFTGYRLFVGAIFPATAFVGYLSSSRSQDDPFRSPTDQPAHPFAEIQGPRAGAVASSSSSQQQREQRRQPGPGLLGLTAAALAAFYPAAECLAESRADRHPPSSSSSAAAVAYLSSLSNPSPRWLLKTPTAEAEKEGSVAEGYPSGIRQAALNQASSGGVAALPVPVLVDQVAESDSGTSAEEAQVAAEDGERETGWTDEADDVLPSLPSPPSPPSSSSPPPSPPPSASSLSSPASPEFSSDGSPVSPDVEEKSESENKTGKIKKERAKAEEEEAVDSSSLNLPADGGASLRTMQELEALGAKLVQVQVVFRHGARTPLTKHDHLWKGVQWDCCGEAYKAVPVVVLGKRSGVEAGPVKTHYDWDSIKETKKPETPARSTAAASEATPAPDTDAVPVDLEADVQVNDLIVDVRRHERELAGLPLETTPPPAPATKGRVFPAQHDRNKHAHAPSSADQVTHLTLHELRHTDDRGKSLVGGCLMGQLTEEGQRQALALGGWLRDAYARRLGVMANGNGNGSGSGEGDGQGEAEAEVGDLREVVWARTTNYSRTIGTLRGVLTGLVAAQDQGGEKEEEQGPRKPWPAITTSHLDEDLFADPRACPRLKTFIASARRAAAGLVAEDPGVEWARDELIKAFPGLTAADFGPWVWNELNDVIASLRANGKPVPPEVTPAVVEVVNRLATGTFATLVAPRPEYSRFADDYRGALLRISMGRLLSSLTRNMERAAAAGEESAVDLGVPLPRVFLFSGHDSTVMPLAELMGHTVRRWPPFAAHVALELWELPEDTRGPEAPWEERHFVRAIYEKEEIPLDWPSQATSGSAAAAETSRPAADNAAACLSRYPTLAAWRREVVGSFLLSMPQYREFCSGGESSGGAGRQGV